MIQQAHKSNEITSQALNLIKECGLRPSPQRIAVAAYVLCHRTHPTADEIFTGLKEQYPSLSRTTVYNTLHSLVSSKGIMEVNVEPGIARFDGYTAPHAHFRCQMCNMIYDIDLLEMSFPEEFDISGVQVNLTGFCPQCRDKSETRTGQNTPY